MGFKDRSYWREDQHGIYGNAYAGGVQFARPKLPQAVKCILIANVAVFVCQIFLDKPRWLGDPGWLSAWFGATTAGFWQVWRYVTFQFLHADTTHLVFNMLGVFFLGPMLEQEWGARRFSVFYLSCGAFAGLAYVLMGAVYGPGGVPIVGASGGVYAILLACAVLFPHVKLLLFFILPISIRVIAVLLFGAMILMVLNSLSYRQLGAQFWSDVAHLGGGAAAAFWLWVLPVIGTKARQGQARLNHGAWERKTRDRLAEQAETDRILDKIRQEGLDSLSDRERERLQEATRKQRQEEHRMRRL